jgi:hypothetical protein
MVYVTAKIGKLKQWNRVENNGKTIYKKAGSSFYAALGPTTDGIPTFCLGAHGVRFSGAAALAIYPTAANTDKPPTSHLSAVCLLTRLNSSKAGSGLTVPSSQILHIMIVYVRLEDQISFKTRSIRPTYNSSCSARGWLGGSGRAIGPPPPPLTTKAFLACDARRASAARPFILIWLTIYFW